MSAPIRHAEGPEGEKRATRSNRPGQAPKPDRVAPGAIRRKFSRGRKHPRGVVWYGLRSFWGHLRHLAASAIATEDIDSRDWMTPDEPREFMHRIAAALGGSRHGSTLADCVGRDVWIDYVADTGDDVSVSRAVGRLIFSEYELPDPDGSAESILAPRGDILFFGGDTAYPVSTADEIRSRVVVPFNQVLVDRPRDRLRVLLGIPGNHDWYDGLDGFGRMFRRQAAPAGGSATLHDSRRTRFGQYADFAKQFVLGGHITKPRTLELVGYVPVQNASYFAFLVAPGIGLLAVDRQLKEIDSRQAHFFQGWLNNNLGISPWVALPDPVYAFGEPSPSGTAMIESLGLNPNARPHFVLSGDIHHYRREQHGPSLHVTAGGGGAFLHPAALGSELAPEVEWPDRPQSRALLASVPIRIALGRAGFIPHLVLALVFAPSAAFLGSRQPRASDFIAAAVTAVLFTLTYAFLGGAREKPAVFGLAAVAGFSTAPLPYLVFHAARQIARFAGLPPSKWMVAAVALAAASCLGAFIFGAYLAALTFFGLERTQAFTALDHPGFKHFVRLRVRADGSAIDGWCLGVVDPLSHDHGKPVLVDTFTWRPLR